jgi:hypothetical protein
MVRKFCSTLELGEKVIHCNYSDSYQIYRFEQENGWIDAHTPIISNDGTRLLTLQPVKQANDTLYTHIVEISTSGTGSKQMTAVTSGMMSVGSILGWDETKNKMCALYSNQFPN